jgi:hypothetical protein
MRRVVVVLDEPLADLARGNANHRVSIGVIGGRAAKNFNTDAALFQLGGAAFQGLLNGVGEQHGVAFAV